MPKYLYSLDLMRGLAALSVVFWHWQHFFFVRGELGAFEVGLQPGFTIFQILYLYGWRAVDLFFVISGFVFFWLYGNGLEKREISAKKFGFLRFSRLYPLHMVTLILVIFLQKIYFSFYGYDFVYIYNNIQHFIFQIFFASNWGFENGFSFNGPIWSVSVEIVCYIVFLFLCLLRLNRFWFLIVAISGLAYLSHISGNRVYHGLLCFLSGGIAFKTFGLVSKRITNKNLYVFVITTILMWILVPYLHSNSGEYYAKYTARVAKGWYVFPGKCILGYMVFIFFKSAYELVLFPLVILTIALIEMKYQKIFVPFKCIGNISYSSYLLHFPLQLIFIILACLFSMSTSFFYTPISLILFFSILIPLSFASYFYFEYPTQQRLRRLIHLNK